MLEVDMHGKIAVVTGATSGIGKEVARGLARMGATVVIGARNPTAGTATASELGGAVHALALDVADPRSIRAFAADVRTRFPQLHVLVNNAGAWFSDRRVSPDGHELTFATNVLGPHRLTEQLLEPLRAARGARVVNVVSGFANNYDAEDLEFATRKYDGFKAYAQSKQALRMLTWGLADRLAADHITVNAVSPGFVRTAFNRNAHGFTATMINAMARVFATSPETGADTPLWAAVAPELQDVTSKYFDRRKAKDGKFRDPSAITALEQRCSDALSQPSV